MFNIFHKNSNRLLNGLVLCAVLSSCNASRPPDKNAGTSAPATNVRADLLQVPVEISSKPPAMEGQTAISIVNEQKPLSSTPEEKKFEAKSDSPFWIRGWAFDEVKKSTPEILWIELNREADQLRIFVPAKRTETPDVVEGFKYPWALRSGFDTSPVDRHNIPPGKYAVSIFQVDSKGASQAKVFDTAKVTITFK